MAGLASINIKFTADLKGYSTEMQNALRMTAKVGEKFQNIGNSLSLYVTAPLLLAGGAAVKFATDYEESLNKVDVAFDGSSGKVRAFAKTTLEMYGIAEGTALEMAATFGDMATSMGLPDEKAADMSSTLVGLAGDLASFKNIGIEQAVTALNGVFTGETESLKMLGIVMTEANLKSFAMSQGITKNMKDMTQAEKVHLRYAYILQNTKNAQGDFARTSDGAANQTRIFQESLKQVGQEVGSVILPYFTKMMSSLNEGVKWFSALSDETKAAIVGVAGLAAAIGPLMSGLGGVITLVPNIIVKFRDLAGQVQSLYAVLAANPWTAVVTVLAAVGTAAFVSAVRFQPLTDVTKELNDVTKQAASSIAKEKSELEKNLAVARNKALSDTERKKAIETLNAISPKYLGNLTLENIHTEEATASTDAYTESLLRKAKVQAANGKLVEVEKKLLDLSLGQLDAVAPDTWQTLFNVLKAGTSQTQLFAETSKTIGRNLTEEEKSLLALRTQLQEMVRVNDDAVDSNAKVADSFEVAADAADAAKVGTVNYYKKQIADLEKVQNSVATTNAKWKEYQRQIEEIEAKLKALTFEGVKLPQASILDDVQPPAPLKLAIDTDMELTKENIKNIVDYFEEESKRALELKQAVAQSAADAFESVTLSFLDSMGLAETGFEGFLKGLAETTVKLIAMALSQSLANSIAGATAAGAATGPASIFTTPAFIQTAIAGVFSAFASIPKFQDGGIVGGSSYFGDKIMARLNSREMISNEDQQRRIWNEMNRPGGSASVDLSGEFRIDGNDLLLAIERTTSRNNRRG
jgi:hypothetical protein